MGPLQGRNTDKHKQQGASLIQKLQIYGRKPEKPMQIQGEHAQLHKKGPLAIPLGIKPQPFCKATGLHTVQWLD